MTAHSSATRPKRSPLSTASNGLWWGLLGVLAFSFTVPLTRVVVADGALSPLFVGAGRAVVAAALAALALICTRQPRPRGRQWLRLAVVAAGVVAGFPLLTSYALTAVPANHGAVVIALLPAATAVLAARRGNERPPRRFWLLAGLGAVLAVGFAALSGGGALVGLRAADLLLLGAVLAAAIGYAEGGLLARELGSWQTISWALVISTPVMLALTLVSIARQPPAASLGQWAVFGYLSAVSMFLGFFAWYRGLALGPMSRVSQVQLVQPVFSIAWAALLLGEPLTWSVVLGGLAVIGCAALAVRARLAPR
ncbi:EamA family transporter [Enemella evansiae]|uniref:DMT family transporter n=1 Tax=Enemella evansiae TaxID=2016499 RepID=UPI000B960479|nr:DMT family transporter [Enemella evansiae]OYO11914.1 EamA family transporter [Enemella evansiae]